MKYPFDSLTIRKIVILCTSRYLVKCSSDMVVASRFRIHVMYAPYLEFITMFEI